MRLRPILLFLLACSMAGLLATSWVEAGRGGGQGRGRQGGAGGPGQGPGWRQGEGPGAQAREKRQLRHRNRWNYERGAEARWGGVVIEGRGRGRGKGQQTRLTLRARSGETRRVHLGPPWYVEGLGLDPQPGDRVEVLGAPHSGRGKGRGEIIAREIRWHGRTYRLRTEEGIPVWAGAKRPRWQHYGGLWNRGRRVEFTGEVEGIDPFAPGGRDMGRGLALRLRARARERSETMTQEREKTRARRRVHLGPSWYINRELGEVQPGEEVSVVGSPAQYEGEEVIIASEIRRGEKRVRLRNAEGEPQWAGGWQNWDGWSAGPRYAGLYDPESVRTVSGRVESLYAGAPESDMGTGAMFRLRTENNEEVRAHLGPLWFAQQAELELKPGDAVTLTGSEVEHNGQQIFMVREMTTDAREIRLRELDGTPVWATAP